MRMSETPDSTTPLNGRDSIGETGNLVQWINENLRSYSDKDWNYSRIRLQPRTLAQMDSPYVLWIEYADSRDQQGEIELKRLKDEIRWGCQHGDELGILEIANLRLNKALLESTTDEHWSYQRPIVRLAKRQQLEAQGIVDAFWYEVEEVSGEDFDSR